MPNIVIASITILTLWCTFSGDMIWPFFSYPMYALPQNDVRYRLVAEDELGRIHPVVGKYILWPVGPNGISMKIKSLIKSQKSKEKFDRIFDYFHTRYLSLKKLHPLPIIKKVYIVRTQKDQEEYIYTYVVQNEN